MMPKYKVVVSQVVGHRFKGEVEIEAESIEDAEELAHFNFDCFDDIVWNDVGEPILRENEIESIELIGDDPQ